MPHFTRITAAVLVTLGLLTGSPASAAEPETARFAEDWARFRELVELWYAYSEDADFAVVPWLDANTRQALASREPEAFIRVLRRVAWRFGDPHFNVGPYEDSAYTVIPTGSDVWAEWQDGHARIVDVRADSAAAQSGLLPGWVIETIDGLTPREAALRALDLVEASERSLQFGLNVALAGVRHRERHWQLRDLADQAITRTLPPTLELIKAVEALPPVTVHWHGRVARIRFNNSLGNFATIDAFAESLRDVTSATALILDLRGTPSGGNSTVARGVLGHFVSERKPFQVHTSPVERRFAGVERYAVEYVSPRLPRVDAPTAVLAGRWTGSMGEGMVIGMDALGFPTVGARMAGLLGALTVETLPQSGAFIEIATEALFHVDGTPREQFTPRHAVEPADLDPNGDDAALRFALKLLSGPAATSP